MNKEYDKILKIIEEKLELLNISIHQVNNQKNLEQMEMLNSLHKLISNKFEKFFSDVNFDVAINILIDLGFNKESAMEQYLKLLEEDRKKEFVYMDSQQIFDENKNTK